jgi:hypothetical protein
VVLVALGQTPRQASDDEREVVAEQSKGFWRSLADGLAPNPEVLASGVIDGEGTGLAIYRDGTFTIRHGFGKESQRQRLLTFEHDVASILAANNRGVVYVTVVGESSGLLTFTTRNPSGAVLTAIRSLKVAADVVIAHPNAVGRTVPATAAALDASPRAETSSNEPNPAKQLRQLADLLEAGALSREEFDAAKARLLQPNPAKQLQQLADLLEAGALTREEFDAAKARLLG